MDDYGPPAFMAQLAGGGMLVNIQVLENGWLVQINRPHEHQDPTEKLYLSIAQVLPEINRLAGSGMARGVDDELDSYKENDADREAKAQAKLTALKDGIVKAFKGEKLIHKPHETYVFVDFAKLQKFLSEVLKPCAESS